MDMSFLVLLWINHALKYSTSMRFDSNFSPPLLIHQPKAQLDPVHVFE